MSVVRPEFGPTLPELLAPLPRAVKLAIAGCVAAVALVAAWSQLGRSSPEQTEVVVRADPPFNLVYRAGLSRVAPQGAEALRLTGPGGRVFSVTPLHLPAYRGELHGFLPLYASGVSTQMRRRFDSYTLRYEGRARVNDVPGHELLFQYRRNGRTAYGRRILLLPDEPGARDGAELLLLSDRSAAIPRMDAIGRNGPLKPPLRSFRFGAQRP